MEKPTKNPYTGCILLHGIGDAMGYRGGSWEFALSTTKILNDLDDLTQNKGPMHLDVSNWVVSDDTVEHLATGEGLVEGLRELMKIKNQTFDSSLDILMRAIARKLKASEKDMTGRAPGKSEMQGLKLLDSAGANWRAKPFDSRSGGCGAAMRTSCLGLLRNSFSNVDETCRIITGDSDAASDDAAFAKLPSWPSSNLFATALIVEASRLTKTCPHGYLGGFVAAYFTNLAKDGMVPPKLWGCHLVSHGLPLVEHYVLHVSNRHVDENKKAKIVGSEFDLQWRRYLALRQIEKGHDPTFPSDYDQPSVRDAAYAVMAKTSFNKSGKNPGSCGLSAVLIAYDALLYSLHFGKLQDAVVKYDEPMEPSQGLGFSPNLEAVYSQLIYSAVLHRGDNDSTGSIAMSWLGALFGLDMVPEIHKNIEKAEKLRHAGVALKTLTS